MLHGEWQAGRNLKEEREVLRVNHHNYPHPQQSLDAGNPSPVLQERKKQKKMLHRSTTGYYYAWEIPKWRKDKEGQVAESAGPDWASGGSSCDIVKQLHLLQEFVEGEILIR